MGSRLTVYRKDGTLLTQIDTVSDLAWVMNDMGALQFPIAITDEKCKQQYLEFGNLVLWEHDKLPSWGGVIATPRNWKNGYVVVTAYSPHYLLKFRLGSSNKTITGTAGDIFKTLIETVNLIEFTRIRTGDIWSGGVAREITISTVKDIFTSIKELSEQSGNDFDFTPEFDDEGKLYFSANWYQQQGSTRTTALCEGHNIELVDSIYTEQGDIINELTGFGEGATSSTRPSYIGRDDDSISQYGLRQGSVRLQGNTSTGTIRSSTEAILDLYKQPRRTFLPTALDVGNTYSSLRLGNTLPLQLATVGFNGDGFGIYSNVRIKGMRIVESDGKVPLIVDEV